MDFSIRVFSATGDPLRTIQVPSGWTQPTAALWPSCAFFNGRLLVAAERIEATKEKKIVALKGVGMRP